MLNWIYEEGRVYYEDDAKKILAEAVMAVKDENEVDIEHVYVDASLRGQGIAGKLMEAVAEYLRTNQKKAVASCPYANTWLTKNKEKYEDIISADFGGASACRIDGRH